MSEIKSTPAIALKVEELASLLADDDVVADTQNEVASASLKLYDVDAIRTVLTEISTRHRDKEDVSKIKAMLRGFMPYQTSLRLQGSQPCCCWALEGSVKPYSRKP